MPAHQSHDEFGGLHRDLFATGAAISRRRMLRFAASLGMSLGAFQLLGFGANESKAAARPGDCAEIPEETAGPFPAHRSSGPNVLNQAGVVRRDIRSSFAGLKGTADGVPLNVVLHIVSASTCAPLAGRAVYIWHCDRPARYSLYEDGVTEQNYLRGVQGADADGKVTFRTIFPGCYMGRWPHIHFEVFPSLAAATVAANRIATSQIALPKSACDPVYATSGYEDSVTNLSRISLATDGVFRDGASLELATITGDTRRGMTAMLTVAV